MKVLPWLAAVLLPCTFSVCLSWIASLIRGNRPDDEMFLIPFSDEIGPFKQLTPQQRSRPPVIAPFGNRGSAL